MNNPALQRRADQILATAPQRVFVGAVTVAVALVTSLALARSSTAADGWLVVLVTLFAIGAVLQPDDHLGLVTIVLLGAHWIAADHSTTSPWSLAIAGSILLFHSLLAVMAVTPHTADVPPALLVRWSRRGLVVGVVAVGVWGLAVVLDRREAPGNLGLSVAAYFAVVLAMIALHTAQRHPHGERD